MCVITLAKWLKRKKRSGQLTWHAKSATEKVLQHEDSEISTSLCILEIRTPGRSNNIVQQVELKSLQSF